MWWPSPDLPKHFLSPSEAYKHSACIEHLATSRKAAKRRFLKSNRRIVRIVSQICACFFSNVSGISKNPLKSGVNIHKNYIQLLCGSDSTEFTPSKPQFTKSLPYSASGIVSQICAGFFAKVSGIFQNSLKPQVNILKNYIQLFGRSDWTVSDRYFRDFSTSTQIRFETKSDKVSKYFDWYNAFGTFKSLEECFWWCNSIGLCHQADPKPQKHDLNFHPDSFGGFRSDLRFRIGDARQPN